MQTIFEPGLDQAILQQLFFNLDGPASETNTFKVLDEWLRVWLKLAETRSSVTQATVGHIRQLLELERESAVGTMGNVRNSSTSSSSSSSEAFDSSWTAAPVPAPTTSVGSAPTSPPHPPVFPSTGIRRVRSAPGIASGSKPPSVLHRRMSDTTQLGPCISSVKDASSSPKPGSSAACVAAGGDGEGSGRDELAIEMIADFLMLCPKEILHHVFINWADSLPTRFHDIFTHLTSKSSQADIQLMVGLLRLEPSPLDRLPFEHTNWVADVECCVCLRLLSAMPRLCCRVHVCEGCLVQYFMYQVNEEGRIQIPCPNPACDSYVYKEEVIFHLPSPTKEKFVRFITDACSNSQKTCPRCSYITTMQPAEVHAAKRAAKKNKKVLGGARRTGVNVTCPQCRLIWCFTCHSPDHTGISCRVNRAGDKQLRRWAHMTPNQAQRNARRCPKCKVFIQRSEGCPHMVCTQCHTKWCYTCGGRRLKFKLIGGHENRLSILGCPDIFMRNRPHLRRFIRGTLFTLGLVLVPPLAVAAAGIVLALSPLIALGIGIFCMVKCCPACLRRHSLRSRAYRQREEAMERQREFRQMVERLEMTLEVERARQLDGLGEGQATPPPPSSSVVISIPIEPDEVNTTASVAVGDSENRPPTPFPQ